MDHTRHMNLFDASRCPVTLIGAGGIGALTAVVLAKMGVPYLEIFDNDGVDEVNLATQFHRVKDVGKPKAHAVAALVREFSDETITETWVHRITQDIPLIGNRVVISAVDSITARKAIWSVLDKQRTTFYLDARMAAEEFHLYCVDAFLDWKWYDQLLAGEDESTVTNIPCTAKATIYTAAIAAGHIGHTVKEIVCGNLPPRVQVHHIAKYNLLRL